MMDQAPGHEQLNEMEKGGSYAVIFRYLSWLIGL